MATYRCDVCDFVYDEAREGVRWDDLPDDWVCPVCGAEKALFHKEEAVSAMSSPDQFRRTSDELEHHMADIHAMAGSYSSMLAGS